MLKFLLDSYFLCLFCFWNVIFGIQMNTRSRSLSIYKDDGSIHQFVEHGAFEVRTKIVTYHYSINFNDSEFFFIFFCKHFPQVQEKRKQTQTPALDYSIIETIADNETIPLVYWKCNRISNFRAGCVSGWPVRFSQPVKRLTIHDWLKKRCTGHPGKTTGPEDIQTNRTNQSKDLLRRL